MMRFSAGLWILVMLATGLFGDDAASAPIQPLAAPAAFVLMAAPEIDDRRPAFFPNVESVSALPVSDYRLWRTSWGELISRHPDEAYEFVENYRDGRNYFLPMGAYIITVPVNSKQPNTVQDTPDD